MEVKNGSLEFNEVSTSNRIPPYNTASLLCYFLLVWKNQLSCTNLLNKIKSISQSLSSLIGIAFKLIRCNKPIGEK